MACENCLDCNNRIVKDGPVQPVAIFCDLTENADCPNATYDAELVFDATCNPLWAVVLLCDGVPDGATNYFDMAGFAVTPAMPLRTDCLPGRDYEQLCDQSDPQVYFIGVWDATDTPPTLEYFVPMSDGTLQPYVPVGQVRACGGDPCLAPIQFCFISSVTEDVEGRMFDLTLPLAQGFAVEALLIDLVSYPLNIGWAITDIDGSEFATNLQSAIQSQFTRFGAQVTVTPPNITSTCGAPENFQIHIECVEINNSVPTLVQLRYNAGRDLVQNPAYVETPAGACGNGDAFDRGGYRLLRRMDNGGTLNCTAAANRGWESDDALNEFEVWCNTGVTQQLNVTPTPRATPVQEINANGASNNPGDGIRNGQPDTIWQTFTANASGSFIIEAVVGGRTGTEQFQIRLSTGDTNGTGIGDLINDTIDALQVTNRSNPWTRYTQTVNLTAGQTYTLSLRGPATGQASFGGLFTDLRAYQNVPGTLGNFVNNDETCMREVTTETKTCAYWQPICSSGNIVSWRNVATTATMTNAEFWAQVPAPGCCLPPEPDEGAGGGGNIGYSDIVCATLNGIVQNVIRQVISDPSGGVILETFIGMDGAPITPNSWTPGQCGAGGPDEVEYIMICADGAPAVRKTVRNNAGAELVSFEGAGGAAITPAAWTPGPCQAPDIEQVSVCLEANTTTGDYDTGDKVTLTQWFSLATGTPVLVAQTAVNVTRGAATVPTPLTAAQFDSCTDDTELEYQLQPFCFIVNASPPQIHSGYALVQLTGTAAQTLYYYEIDTGLTHQVADVTPVECVQDQDPLILCDANGQFLRHVTYGSFGNIQGVRDTTLAGAPYTAGAIVPCTSGCENTVTRDILCEYDPLTGGVIAPPVTVVTVYDCDGVQASQAIFDFTGAPYVPTGVLGPCGGFEIETERLCDDNGAFVRAYQYGGAGTVTGVNDFDLAGAAYTVVGVVRQCEAPDIEAQTSCLQANAAGTGYAIGDQLTLTRWYSFATGSPVQIGETAVNNTQGGATVATPLTVADFDACADVTETCRTVQTYILCDVNGATTIRFTRTVIYDCLGLPTSFADRTLNGVSAYVPTGTVTSCQGRDYEKITCTCYTDANNTPFTRHFFVDPADPTAAMVTIDLDQNDALFTPVLPITPCTMDTPTMEGATLIVASAATGTYTFTEQPQSISVGNVGANILRLTIVTDPVSSGNQFYYVMPNGSAAIDVGFGVKIVSVTVLNQGSTSSTVLINGLTPGGPQ